MGGEYTHEFPKNVPPKELWLHGTPPFTPGSVLPRSSHAGVVLAFPAPASAACSECQDLCQRVPRAPQAAHLSPAPGSTQAVVEGNGRCVPSPLREAGAAPCGTYSLGRYHVSRVQSWGSWGAFRTGEIHCVWASWDLVEREGGCRSPPPARRGVSPGPWLRPPLRRGASSHVPHKLARGCPAPGKEPC